MRSILECYLTLSYMIKSNNSDIWKTYRVYGNGQAKLAFLKLSELDDAPDFINVDILQNLADEDSWMEFLTINVGHWEKTTLRDMSIKSDNKDDYDKYYSWSSTYTHGQWCAVRDTCYLTCANPLHRLHRVPDPDELLLENISLDAILIVNKILDLLNGQYPDFSYRMKRLEDKQNQQKSRAE